MRGVATVRVNPRAWALALLVVTVCALVLAAPAFAASSSAAPLATDTSSPTASPSPVATTLTCVLSKTSLVYGNTVTVSGQLDPAAEGEEVEVKLGSKVVGTTLTDAAGAYTLTFTPRRNGDVVASLTSDPTVTSDPQALAVKPKATVSHGKLVPFLRSSVVVKIAPSAYSGRVVIRVIHRGAVVGTFKARAKSGRAKFAIPLRGVDGFALRVIMPAADNLTGRSFEVKVSVRAKTLRVGSSGAYVKGMLTALQRLKFRVPNVGTRFTTQVKDSVMAFQKAYRLSRSYVFNTACWRKIDGAKVIKPKYSSPSKHLEVDKTRQILMVVKGGKPAGIICVSTGATGNTPVGSFRIQQKHLFTTSGYGGVLVRTMGFVGNFAIHGYSPVPPYPASHGCVREPIWACYWVYNNSFVGERLYIYR